MKRAGIPGDFKGRLARATSVERSPATVQPLDFLVEILRHQLARSSEQTVRSAAAEVTSSALEARLTDRWPLMQLERAASELPAELEICIRALVGRPTVPDPLNAAGRGLGATSEGELGSLIDVWLDDPALLDPRLALWVRVSAAPVLELAAARIDPPSRDEWSGRACPACGDVPQCSAIVEESGGFLQGAPRYLICGRCALWWPFPRATCPTCGEDDSRRIDSLVAEGLPWARLDVCNSCRSYIKTFDLREKGARDVVPLVDDVATLTLDVWAHENDLHRPGLSLAGV